jgi:ribosomal protein L34E
VLDHLWHSWSVEGSNNLVFTSKMAKTKPSVRRGPGGMICREQLATRDGRRPCVTAPRAVTVAEVERNEACAPVCTAAAEILRSITDPVDGEVLEGALGQAFIALDQTDWMSHLWLLRPTWVWVAATVRIAPSDRRCVSTFCSTGCAVYVGRRGVWTKTATRI